MKKPERPTECKPRWPHIVSACNVNGDKHVRINCGCTVKCPSAFPHDPYAFVTECVAGNRSISSSYYHCRVIIRKVREALEVFSDA